MQNDIEAIKFISRDHAVIKCSRIKKEVSSRTSHEKVLTKPNDASGVNEFHKPLPKHQP
jgi:hypothetical protein